MTNDQDFDPSTTKELEVIHAEACLAAHLHGNVFGNNDDFHNDPNPPDFHGNMN